MPLADFPGHRNWGYDGVLPFAPDASYGSPTDLKRLVDAAHERGLMIFLDVVYNHFGPEGNWLSRYAPQFFTDGITTPWGPAIDFGCREVRDFFIHNALYWLEEYRFDGLRLDAVHAMHDRSSPDILEELARAASERVGSDRCVHLVLENDDNAARYLSRSDEGRPCWFTAQWNDDFHHAAHVLVTGEDAGYYADYADRPADRLARCLVEGFAYQGERSAYRGRVRGERSAHLPATSFVPFVQNHDQVGNRAFGERLALLARDEPLKALVTILLLSPSPPLLFMGEEWQATEPFPFFCDFPPQLAGQVREGRRREFARFPQFRDEAARASIPDPNAPATFGSAVLDWARAGQPPHAQWLALYRTLLRIRHRDIAPRLRGLAAGAAGSRRFGAGGIVASGRLGDGASLMLRANLAPESCRDVPAAPPGRPLYATHEPAGGSLPPWFAAWLIDERGPQ
jgi:maltooligosyltrehalose trehalohydrolase